MLDPDAFTGWFQRFLPREDATPTVLWSSPSLKLSTRHTLSESRRTLAFATRASTSAPWRSFLLQTDRGPTEPVPVEDFAPADDGVLPLRFLGGSEAVLLVADRRHSLHPIALLMASMGGAGSVLLGPRLDPADVLAGITAFAYPP